MKTETTLVTVRGSEHDQGAKPIEIRRPAGERAEWSADLMRRCGYQKVEIVTA